MKIGNASPALQVDGATEGRRTRTMHGIAPHSPKANIQSGMPHGVMEGSKASFKARTENSMAPGSLPDTGKFVQKMEDLQALALRGRSSSTDLSI